MNLSQLRQLHPVFIYQDYTYIYTDNNFIATFTYKLNNGPTFTHQVTFNKVNRQIFNHQPIALINNLVFNLGLIELFSYWKLACSPTIKIDCGYLSKKQLSFWRDLLINGMSEYFYVNKINFTVRNFIQFEVRETRASLPVAAIKKHSGIISALNLGGGKDSAVLLSIFSQKPEKFVNVIVEPASPAATKMAKISEQLTHFITRRFDPQLFELNSQNYLNGHVPFSASLAFINLLAGVLYDFDFAIVGNEQSANEVSLYWLDQPINHQFSKSTKFEQSFREYSSQYLIKNVEYLSFIRPITELKIAQILSTNSTFFSVIKSCNRGQQKDIWCHDCSKCLFVFLILFPFINEQILTTQIFQSNLFDNLNLLTDLKKLLGLVSNKPLECVGTIQESRAAFYLSVTKYEEKNLQLPALLSALKTETLALSDDWPNEVNQLLNYYDTHNFLPAWAAKLLTSKL